jgi:type IV pilus assembly PilX-like protein
MNIPQTQIESASHRRSCAEQGVALLLALLVLLVLSAIGLGLMYMSSTDTTINSNYRDAESAFYSMRAGLEEARDRIRATSAIGGVNTQIPLPTTIPGTPNSIVYLINPAGVADVVDPKSPTLNGSANPYFDDELCHESFGGSATGATGIRCAAYPFPTTSVAPYVNSLSPGSNTVAAMKYKWVRVTLKQNCTLSANGAATTSCVNAAAPTTDQVCFQTIGSEEIPLSQVPGGPFASCTAAYNKGAGVAPVYVLTALAVTSQGSRRIGQYEISGLTFNTPPGGLSLDGPNPTYNSASSNPFQINGTDTGSAGYNGPGACSTNAGVQPAISVDNTVDQTTVTNNLFRPTNYTGLLNGGSSGNPSVVNSGSSGTGTLSGAWTDPAQLDALVQTLASSADVTYNNCSVNGGVSSSGQAASPCSPTNSKAGTTTSPQITFVNGDFNYGNASGAGVLVVTGNLTMGGNGSFSGLILVIGQGNMIFSGGGNGSITGSVFVAHTDATSYSASCASGGSGYCTLASLASPSMTWSGGGGNGIQYNSCWADLKNDLKYDVVGTREEMY